MTSGAALRLDHIVVGSTDLAEGVAWAEATLGVPPGGGGQHPKMGTHNALWSLGAVFFEVIAIDPQGSERSAPRWYGLDHPATQSKLAERPRLLAYAAEPTDLAATLAAAPVPLGRVETQTRGDLTWQFVVPEDGVPPVGGALPALLKWQEGAVLPPARLPNAPLTLTDLVCTGGPAKLPEMLAAMGAAHLIRLEPGGETPALRAEIDTPGGPVVLD
ncbi:MAG: VOC family protein [Pseudomonadota bacterium]